MIASTIIILLTAEFWVQRRLGYIHYVFEDLEYKYFLQKYIMCVRFPNWNQAVFNKGDEGYVTVRYVQEGITTWFDGKEFIPYKKIEYIN